MLSKIGEDGIVKHLLSRIAKQRTGVIVPPGDDCAVVQFGYGKYCAISTDLLIEDVHFDLKTIKPSELGYKSLAVNLSDLAAMAAVPKFAQIGLGLPKKMNTEFLDSFYDGLLLCADKFDTAVTGGDISATNNFVISITVLGESDPMLITRRSDAKVDDLICVTGMLGSSAAGLEILKNPLKYESLSDQIKKDLINAHLMPVPRVDEAIEMAKIGINAMEDISDGLAADLRHICEASGVGAEVTEATIPLSAEFEAFTKLYDKNALDLILSGGEDYELLFTAPKSAAPEIKSIIEKKYNLPVTIIGKIVPKQDSVEIVLENGKREALTGGYNHFSE